jgi:septum formation protein
MQKIKLILGSASPRRKELLSHLGISFEMRPSNINEDSDIKDPFNHSLEIAFRKNIALLNEKTLKNEIILTADTIVAIDGKILGKPKDLLQAKEMLSLLSGRTHTVATAIVVSYFKNEWKHWKHVEMTHVTFAKISDETLERYLLTGESMDKAGAYGIQGSSLSFISKVEGCYATVVGFPLGVFLNFMEQHLSKELCWEKPWRSYFTSI